MDLGVFRSDFSFLAYADGEPLGFIIGHENDAYAEATGIRDLCIPLVGDVIRTGLAMRHVQRAPDGQRRPAGVLSWLLCRQALAIRDSQS
jgi:hypothetical protein